MEDGNFHETDNRLNIIELKYVHLEKELAETKQDIDKRIEGLKSMILDLTEDQVDLRNDMHEGFKTLNDSMYDLKKEALEYQPPWAAREYSELSERMMEKNKVNGVLLGVSASLLTVVVGAVFEVLKHYHGVG